MVGDTQKVTGDRPRWKTLGPLDKAGSAADHRGVSLREHEAIGFASPADHLAGAVLARKRNDPIEGRDEVRI